MTQKQNADLRRWTREFGDLSGIVYDLNSQEIISGNQRGRVWDIANCEIVYTSQAEEPDEQGTVGIGYVIWEGSHYNYREVRWTPEQCEQANIIANRAGGSWDFDILGNQFEQADLLDWGFEPFEFGNMYQPDMNPSIGNKNYNEDDITIAKGKLDEKFSKAGRELLSTLCPYCGEEFHVEK